jgi:hypothetical protein
VIRGTLSVSWILGDIVQANHALAVKRRREHGGRARLRKSLERLLGHTGQGVEHVGVAGLRIDDVIEEGAEFCVRDRGRRIRHLLDDRLLIEGRCHRDADATERF